MTFRWIDAVDLELWAPRIRARTEFAEVIGDLVRASAPSATAFRFPSGDAGETRGFDGFLEAVAIPPYVPEGKSIWELGTGEKPEDKADDDYKKRTANPQFAVPSECTFVFATPRRWADGGTWAAARKAEGVWKDVRVLDSNDLAEWLLRSPMVAYSLAKRLGKAGQTGIRSGADFWEGQSVKTDPATSEALLLAGRDDSTKLLLERLGGPPQDIVIQADSPDEAIAFVVATIRTSPEKARDYLLSKFLVVTEEEAARGLGAYQRLIVAVRGSATGHAPVLMQRGHHVIVPLGNSAPSQVVTTLRLARPPGHVFAKALEGMGLSTLEAEQAARGCGRSVTILQRRMPRTAHNNVPLWVTAEAARILIPALFAGSWDSDSEHDQEVLRRLAGADSYAQFESKLTPYLSADDRPVERAGTIWQPVAPADCLSLIGKFATQAEITSLSAVAVDVFRELDPLLDLPPEEREFAAMRGKRALYSGALRSGLAGSLVLIAAQGDACQLPVNGGAARFVEAIVAGIPGLRDNPLLLASLSRQLPALMEAAPPPFLSALEHMLGGDPEKLKVLFSEGGQLGVSSPHTGVLWGLEGLAWTSDYLPQAALILAKLARLDPGGRLSNRPINSLIEIFLGRHPGTSAPFGARLRVLDQVIKKEPEIGWSLLVAVASERHSVSHGTHKPQWREGAAVETRPVTWADVFEAHSAYVERLLKVVADAPSAKRWTDVIEVMFGFEPTMRESVRQLMLAYASSLSDEGDRRLLWDRLRKQLAHHRQFPDAQWAIKENELKPWDDVLAVLEPTDPIDSVLWLFADEWVDLPGVAIEGRETELAKRRDGVLRDLIRRDGIAGLYRLRDAVKRSGAVGSAFVRVAENSAVVDQILLDAERAFETQKEFASGIAYAASDRFGEDWRVRALSMARNAGWSAEHVAWLLVTWPDGPETWNRAADLGPEIERSYWLQRYPWWRGDTAEEFLFLAEKYLAVGRAGAALATAHRAFKKLPTAFLLRLLDEVGRYGSKDGGPMDQLDGYNLQQLLAELGTRTDVPAIEIARREYAFLPVFGYDGKPQMLHRLLAEDPSMFMEVLCHVYKPSVESGLRETEQKGEPTADLTARAERGWRLLNSFKKIPGTDDAGAVHAEKLRAWVDEVRRLAKERGRSEVADQQIGRTLAHAPADPADGAWPHVAIRDLVDDVAAEHIETGIEIEQFNKRGVYSKGIYDGGAQERKLAEQADTWAEASANWPRMQKVLKTIAASWRRHADQEDIQVEQRKMEFQ